MDVLTSFIIYCVFAAACISFASKTLGENASIVADIVDAMIQPETRMAVLFSPQHMMEVGSLRRYLNVSATIWTCPRSSSSYERFLRFVTQYPDDYPRPALILVPQHTNLPKHVLKEIPRFQKYYSNVHWVFSIKEHGAVLDKLRNYSCQVITVTEDNISAPHDGYRSCEERKYFDQPHALMWKGDPRDGSYPRNTRVIYAVYDSPGNHCGMSYGNAANATIEAYSALNNSLVYRCNNNGVDHSALLERRVDIIVGQRSANCPDHCFFYRYAMYQPIYHYFLVRRRTPEPPSFVNTWLWFFSLSFMLLAPFASVFFFVVNLRQQFRPEGTFSTSAAADFLVSIFLGRSPPPMIEPRAMSIKVLLVSWMLGMLFFGSFVHINITAARSVPSYSAEIRSMRELLARLEDGTLLPCMNPLIANIIRKGNGEISYIQILRRALDRCGSKCALGNDYWDKCMARIKEGTHAGIVGYTAFSLALALQKD